MQAPEPPSTSPESASSRASGARRGKIATLGATVVVVVIVGLIALILMKGLGSQAAGPGLAPVADWQTYHDPLGLFSVKMPPGWRAQIEMGTSGFGNRTGSSTEPQDVISLSDPGEGQASARFSIMATPIRTDFERAWYCSNIGPTSDPTTFHGFPASRGDSLPAPQNGAPTWLFESGNAHFQLDLTIPGDIQPTSFGKWPAVTPTPLPQATVATDRANLQAMLDSFQPSGATPLACH